MLHMAKPQGSESLIDSLPALGKKLSAEVNGRPSALFDGKSRLNTILVKKTIPCMIIYQSDCLHIGIHDRTAHKSETALF